jgi:hypothetical protein
VAQINRIIYRMLETAINNYKPPAGKKLRGECSVKLSARDGCLNEG